MKPRVTRDRVAALIRDAAPSSTPYAEATVQSHDVGAERVVISFQPMRHPPPQRCLTMLQRKRLVGDVLRRARELDAHYRLLTHLRREYGTAVVRDLCDRELEEVHLQIRGWTASAA